MDGNLAELNLSYPTQISWAKIINVFFRRLLSQNYFWPIWRTDSSYNKCQQNFKLQANFFNQNMQTDVQIHHTKKDVHWYIYPLSVAYDNPNAHRKIKNLQT